MKSISSIISIWFFVSLFIGCENAEDYLETVNKSNLTDETIWGSEGNADIYLNHCYGDLVQKSNFPDILDNFTDDFDTPSGNVFTSFFWKSGICVASRDDFTAWRGQAGPKYDANWDDTYRKVRKLNTYISKINEFSDNFSNEYIDVRTDEAKFLRAYFYSELFMRLGGLVIITSPQDRSEMNAEDLYIPRSSFEETYNFIINELDEILQNKNLEIKYENGNGDAGRATLGAALALKGWLQIFAASPAYNSTEPSVPRENNLQSFDDYDENRWVSAANTNREFIETFGHKGSNHYSLFGDLSKFWYEENEYNEEVIWDRQHVGTSMPNSLLRTGGGPVFIHGSYYNWGNFNPTQELVEEFRMSNGKDIDDPNSGYDPNNPYVNREKRFYDFIIYDGAPYKQDWMTETDTIYYRIDKVNPSLNEIDFSGADRSKTGYDVKKRIDNLHSAAGYRDNGMNHVYYRYAEVILNYAEAQNEAVGPDQSVYDAINYIRQRPSTDLPELEPGLSKDEMREEIYRERRLELFFEDKRLLDLWRWKTAESNLNKPLHRCKIYNSSPSDNSGEWIYEVMELDLPHVFTKNMYFNPVPQSAIDRNPKLKQNWGY